MSKGGNAGARWRLYVGLRVEMPAYTRTSKLVLCRGGLRMFDVIDSAGIQHTVYEVNGAYFLIFSEDPDDYGWRYIPMSECVPAKKDKD